MNDNRPGSRINIPRTTLADLTGTGDVPLARIGQGEYERKIPCTHCQDEQNPHDDPVPAWMATTVRVGVLLALIAIAFWCGWLLRESFPLTATQP